MAPPKNPTTRQWPTKTRSKLGKFDSYSEDEVQLRQPRRYSRQWPRRRRGPGDVSGGAVVVMGGSI